MRRIVIVGCGGAGKSTLAREMGRILDIQVFHLDRLHWKPGWIEPSNEEWRQTVENLVRKPDWIIDGNYGGTMDLRFQAADTIIFLDFPTLVCLWRVFRRRWMYRGKTRPDMGVGCPEKLDWRFLVWICGYRRTRRDSILQTLHGYADQKNVVILRNPQEVADFLSEIREKSRD